MAAVLLVLLVAVVGASSLALRGTSGISGTLQLSASRQAREAAENGITEIVAELNRPQNRRLLVSGSSPNAWGSSTETDQQNPCVTVDGTPQPPLTSASTAGNNLWKSAGGNGQYILRSVRYANRDRSARLAYRYATAGSGAASTIENVGGYDNNDPDDRDAVVNLRNVDRIGEENIGHLQLEVQGRVQRGGRTLATSTVVKEYQVIPKCCERSFAGPLIADTPEFSLGNDQRNCPGISDLGLLFGFNEGTMQVSGRAGSLQEFNPDDPATPINLARILCVTTSPTASNCIPPNSVNPFPVSGGRSIPLIPTTFEVDPPPTFGGTGTPTGIITSSGYYRVRADLADIERCNASVTGGRITLTSCANVNFCERVTGSSVADYHCRMNRIRLTSGTVYFDTSRGSIALFFNETSSASDSGTIFIGGSANIYHRYCSSPPSASTGCATVAPASQFTRLSFFGNRDHNNLTFRGGGEATSMFVYFANGTVEIGGSATARGAIWTNALQLNGSFLSATPANNCATLSNGFCVIQRGSLPGGRGGSFDWVARSPVTTRVY